MLYVRCSNFIAMQYRQDYLSSSGHEWCAYLHGGYRLLMTEAWIGKGADPRSIDLRP